MRIKWCDKKGSKFNCIKNLDSEHRVTSRRSVFDGVVSRHFGSHLARVVGFRVWLVAPWTMNYRTIVWCWNVWVIVCQATWENNLLLSYNFSYILLIIWRIITYLKTLNWLATYRTLCSCRNDEKGVTLISSSPGLPPTRDASSPGGPTRVSAPVQSLKLLHVELLTPPPAEKIRKLYVSLR